MNTCLQEEIKHILYRLEEASYEAYLVGGSLRDYFLGINPKDFDIATNASPLEIEKIFQEELLYSPGKKFGTINISFGGYEVEITTFRLEDDYCNNRKPKKVRFTNRLEDDLARRDFTINAMAMDLRGCLFDFHGGKLDLDSKILRTIGGADDRLREDALRILRAIRFSASLGFRLDNDLRKAIISNAHLLKNISKERIGMEFNKIILLEKPSLALKMMADLDIIELLYPDLARTIGYDQKNPHHTRTLFDHLLASLDYTPNNLSLRLAALFHDIGKPYTLSIDEAGIGHFYGHDKLGAKMATYILKENRYSNKIVDKVSLLIENHMKISEYISDKGLRRQIKKIGPENIFDLYDLMIADRRATEEGRDFCDLLQIKNKISILLGEEIQKDRFLDINGNDIIDLGFKEGKIIGDILLYLENLVIDDPSLNTKEKLIEIIIDKYRR